MPIDEMSGRLFRNLRKLLFHPFQFFESMPEHPRLLPPLLLILGICLVRSVWYSQVLADYMVRLLEGSSFPTGGFALWSMVLLTIGPAIRWVLVAGIVFAISALLRGKGSFSQLFAYTAYGLLVGYMISLIQAIFSVLAGRQIMHEVSRLMMGSGYLSFPNLATDPTIAVFWMVFWLIGTIGFVWTFIVHVAATQYGRYIPRTHALLTVILAFVCMYGVVWMQVLFVRHIIT
ncbi:YIP1 family protein [Methanoculleus chikugoensis]|uniref:YIP1 family protein n=1 Tax=Methanoculleus chikugoensis TaxID=118126 RepID=UPI001C815AC9|nr:YIP1 family protein [Methanoculleus chikugoensis]